jgi:hypothetical protein
MAFGPKKIRLQMIARYEVVVVAAMSLIGAGKLPGQTG